ncbi:MAG: alpha/beta hydrolase [Candidatus Thorarchaeota archaeon]
MRNERIVVTNNRVFYDFPDRDKTENADALWSDMTSVKVIPTEFESDGATVQGHFVISEGEGPFPGICKFHGLPGGPDQTSGIATRFAEAGFVVLTFDFRGFRSSEGVFSLSNQIKDARVAVSHLLESELIDESWVGVYGASFGGAVAVCAAASDSRIDAVCLRAPVYDTAWFVRQPMMSALMEEIAAADSTQVRGIEDTVMREKMIEGMLADSLVYNPMNDISKVSPRPLLIVHGTDDVSIDLAGVKRLFEQARDPKDLIVVEGADHRLSDPQTRRITEDTIVNWFKALVTRE